MAIYCQDHNLRFLLGKDVEAKVGHLLDSLTTQLTNCTPTLVLTRRWNTITVSLDHGHTCDHSPKEKCKNKTLQGKGILCLWRTWVNAFFTRMITQPKVSWPEVLLQWVDWALNQTGITLLLQLWIYMIYIKRSFDCAGPPTNPLFPGRLWFYFVSCVCYRMLLPSSGQRPYYILESKNNTICWADGIYSRIFNYLKQ